MDEARKVIRRLERIEALQSAKAPAEELLGEVRQLLSEGEAWIAAEHDGARRENGAGPAGEGEAATAGAAAALRGCLATLAEREEVAPGPAEHAPL